jgi:SAM-dependent methyltransferase
VSPSKFRDHTSVAPAEYESDRSGRALELRAALLEPYVEAAGPKASVLELGSGTGSLLARLASAHPPARFMGVEIDQPLYEFAQAEHGADNVEFHRGDVAEVADRTFDLVFSVDVIHHLKDREATFTAIRRSVRPGARWIVMEPNIFHPWMLVKQERMKRAGLDEDHFRPWQVVPEWERTGWVLEGRRYQFFFPPGMSLRPALQKAEGLLERTRLTGASVVAEIRAA